MHMDRVLTETISNLSLYNNILAALMLILFLVLFYRDIVFACRSLLVETAAKSTMPIGRPLKYKGVRPGSVANDPGVIAWQLEPFIDSYRNRLSEMISSVESRYRLRRKPIHWRHDIVKFIFDACGLFTERIYIDALDLGIRAEFIEVLIARK